MTGLDVPVIVGLCVVGLVYGIIRYTNAENTDYNELVKVVQLARAENLSLQKFNKEISEKLSLIEQNDRNWVARLEALEKEMDNHQDHMARLRKGQIALRDRSYPRDVNLKIHSTVPIEIVQKPVTESERTLKKIRKQINTLSQ